MYTSAINYQQHRTRIHNHERWMESVQEDSKASSQTPLQSWGTEWQFCMKFHTFEAYCTSIRALLEFVTTLGKAPNSNKIQYVTESDKAALPEYDIRNRLSGHRMQCLRIRFCDYLILWHIVFCDCLTYSQWSTALSDSVTYWILWLFGPCPRVVTKSNNACIKNWANPPSPWPRLSCTFSKTLYCIFGYIWYREKSSWEHFRRWNFLLDQQKKEKKSSGE